MNWQSRSSKLCHGKVRFACGTVTRSKPESSNPGSALPGTALSEYNQPRVKGNERLAGYGLTASADLARRSAGGMRSVGSDALRHRVPMGIDELVHHGGYLVEREHARRVPVEHRGVVDVVAVAFEGGPHRKVLDRGMWGAVGGQLRGKLAIVAGTEARPVDSDR